LAYDISFPDTPRNRQLFGFPARLGFVREKKRFDFRAVFSGRVLINGSIEVTQTSKDEYSAYATDAAGTLADIVKGKNIRDLDYGNDVAFTNKGEYTPGSDDYCLFPVLNVGFFENKGPSWDDNGTTKYYNWDAHITNGSKQNKYNSGNDNFDIYTWDIAGGGDQYENLHVITPFPFLQSVLKRMFRSLSRELMTGLLETDNDIKRMCFYSNFDIAKFNKITVTTTIIIPNPWGGVTQNSDTEMTGDPYYDNFAWRKILPDMTVKDLLVSLQVLLCGAFDFYSDNTVRFYGKKEVIDSNIFQDWTNKVISSIDVGEVEKKGVFIDWELDDNDVVVSAMKFNDELKDRLNDIGEAVDLYSELEAISTPEVGEIRFVKNDDTWYEYRAEIMDIDGDDQQVFGWYFFGSAWFGKYHNPENSNEEFESLISSPYVQNGYCKVHQPGNRVDFEKAEYSPRLMIYHGKVNGEPLGSSYNRDKNGNVISGRDLSLVWEDSTSLWEKRWKKWGEFLANAIPVSFETLLSPAELEKFDFFKKKRVKDGILLVEDFSVKIGLNDIAPAEITARVIR
jgi:hypothetical protein